MDGTADRDRLALAMLPLLCGILGVRTVDPSVIDSPLFSPDGYRLGPHPVESLHVIEFMVVLEREFGLRLLDPEELMEAATLRGLAAWITRNGDRLAVGRFCETWDSEQ